MRECGEHVKRPAATQASNDQVNTRQNSPVERQIYDFSEKSGWDGRIRTYDTLYQKQLPYHLATSQRGRLGTANASGFQAPKSRKIHDTVSEFSRRPVNQSCLLVRSLWTQ